MQELIIIALSLIGFAISLYIYDSKAKKKKIVCRPGHHCEAVVHSRYSVTLGMPNEILGMVYYGFIAVAYAAFITLAVMISSGIGLGLIVITGLAALFSVYLIFIQAFVLKEWCDWCVASTIVSILIFLAVIF